MKDSTPQKVAVDCSRSYNCYLLIPPCVYITVRVASYITEPQPYWAPTIIKTELLLKISIIIEHGGNEKNQNHHWGETVLIKMHPPPACSIYIYIYIYMHMYVYIGIHTHVPLSVAIWKYTWNICTFCFLKTKGVYISICFSNCNVFENREYIYLCQPVERVCLLALRL